MAFLFSPTHGGKDPMRTKVAVVMCLIAIALIFKYISVAVAQIPDDQRPPLVTDYATYPGTPQAFLTPGCDFSGVINPTFGFQDLETGTQMGPVNNLGLLPDLTQGDLVRMAWTDVSPACVGSAVSFVVKVALGPSFDPNVDQLTGPNGGYSVEFLVAGPGEITFPMPDLARFGLGCDYQLDAIVGIPLQDVGPSGSFFSEALRIQQGKQTADNRTTVISAKNGSYPVCAVQQTTTTTAPATTTTVPTTTTPTTVPTTSPPPVTTVPSTTATFSNVTSQPPVTVVLTPTRPPLAETGPIPGYIILIGLGCLIVGAAFILISRGRKIT